MDTSIIIFLLLILTPAKTLEKPFAVSRHYFGNDLMRFTGYDNYIENLDFRSSIFSAHKRKKNNRTDKYNLVSGEREKEGGAPGGRTTVVAVGVVPCTTILFSDLCDFCNK